MTRTIPLNKGMVAMVDDEDFPLVSAFRWTYSEIPFGTTGYAYGPAGQEKSGPGTKMCHFLVRPPSGMTVDHINGDGLDNRRSNLRICTRAENCRNRRKQRRPTASIYKGVQRCKPARWRAVIRACGVQRHLGTFRDEVEAAKAYDLAARKFHGSFACVNFPLPGESGALAGTNGKAA
jgi:hypothetical protein